jgi:hypothetical protein
VSKPYSLADTSCSARARRTLTMMAASKVSRKSCGFTIVSIC